MSDFLTRLAQRAQGEAATISPRLPSRYAPNADPPLDAPQLASEAAMIAPSAARNEEDAEHGPASVTAPRGSERARRPSSESSATAIAEEHEHRAAFKAAIARPAAFEGPSPSARPAATQAARLPVDMNAEQASARAARREANPPLSAAALEGETPATARERTGADPQMNHALQPATAVTDKDEERTAPAPWRPLLPQVETPSAHEGLTADMPRENNAAPSVHIRIGRVEVRANIGKTTAAPSPPARAASKPALSLDEYLKRGGGKP